MITIIWIVKLVFLDICQLTGKPMARPSGPVWVFPDGSSLSGKNVTCCDGLTTDRESSNISWRLATDGNCFADGAWKPTWKVFPDGNNRQKLVCDGFSSRKDDFSWQLFPDGWSLMVTVRNNLFRRFWALSVTVLPVREKIVWGSVLGSRFRVI